MAGGTNVVGRKGKAICCWGCVGNAWNGGRGVRAFAVGAKDIAAICVMRAVWFADSWLIAAAIAGLVVVGAVLSELADKETAEVGGRAVWTIVSTVLSSVSSSGVSNTL